MKASEVLHEALSTLEERALNYDAAEGERSMDLVIPAFNALTGLHLTYQQGYLFMVILKAARSQQGVDKTDNWIDMAAYAALAGEQIGLDIV